MLTGARALDKGFQVIDQDPIKGTFSVANSGLILRALVQLSQQREILCDQHIVDILSENVRPHGAGDTDLVSAAVQRLAGGEVAVAPARSAAAQRVLKRAQLFEAQYDLGERLSRKGHQRERSNASDYLLVMLA